MKGVLVLLFLFVCNEVRSQCYRGVNSDIAIHWTQLHAGKNPFQEDSDQCLANYTIFNENHIDADDANPGVNCSKRDSTATDGTWTYETDGTVINCTDNTGEVRCERRAGSITLYTAFGCSACEYYPNGIYTCCIEGSCISIRVYQENNLQGLFSNISDAVIENCSIIPPSDVTVIPQQYTVQMNTSGVPPIRLLSNIDCTSNCNGTTFGESYYTLIDLAEERYQYSRPVTWSPDTSDPNPQYKCSAVFGKGVGGTLLNTTLNTSITASNAPTINYEVINATAIRIYWSITGDVNGFIINITSSGMPNVTAELINGSAREFIYNGILPQENYTIVVRGYVHRLGPADTTIVRLEAGISSIEVSLISVSDDLSTQRIEVNCSTFRVKPYEITWKINSESISVNDSTYLKENGSMLLSSANQTYIHYLILNGSFSSGKKISCTTTVNGEMDDEEYILQVALSPPTVLSATILSSSVILISWIPLSDVRGYIVHYTPNGHPQLIRGQQASNITLENLKQETIYQIHVYSFKDLPSASSNNISVFINNEASNNDLSGGAIGGIVIFLLIVLVGGMVVIFGLLLFKRYQIISQCNLSGKLSKQSAWVRYTSKSNDNPSTTLNVPEYAEVEDLEKESELKISVDDYGCTSEAVYYSVPEDATTVFDCIPQVLPVKINELGSYVFQCHRKVNKEFKEQFSKLYNGNEKSREIGHYQENKLLNRFKNITVYDDNRITLHPASGIAAQNEFINAGYVDGYSVPRKFIATQGPLPSTVGDFWHMVWQEKVQFIVMLTNLMEEKKKKCAPYWPERDGIPEMFGSFTIKLVEEERSLHFVVRLLHVMFQSSSNVLVVKHYQYITWPDYGVPESVSPLMTLNRRVMNSWRKDKGPIIVHCSAGVGRTGTFIAIDIALEQAKRESMVDIAGIVTRIRQQRMEMVQTDAQYAFVHDAVLEGVIVGTTEIDSYAFRTQLGEWKLTDRITGKTHLESQFKLLDQVTPRPGELLQQTAEKYPEKNRSSNFLPYEKWRVPLKHLHPDYIHATFVHGYNQKKALIIAQSPMDNTIIDFWKMVMDYKVSAIVMCCSLIEEGKEVCSCYWTTEINKIKVDIETETLEANLIRRKISVSDTRTKDSWELSQFQITNWSSDGMNRDLYTLLKVIECVTKEQQKSGGGPVVVHCSDTVGRSGVFCAASNAIEQCKTEGLVDVFQATKAVRMHKPGAVTNMDQYIFIHDIMMKYLEQNSTYSNFQ